MARFNLRMADKEMEILEQASQETERTKTDILREFIRTLPKHRQPKLTPHTVSNVIYGLHHLGFIKGQPEEAVQAFLKSYAPHIDD